MKPGRLIKMCLSDTYSKAHIEKHLSDAFSVQDIFKEGDALLLLILNFALEYAIGKVQEKSD